MLRPMPSEREDDGTSEILLAEESPSGISLLVIGEGFVTTHGLPASGRVVLGRSSGCEIPIDVSSISRRHAVLATGDRLTIEDLGSSNGTRVRGETIASGSTVEIAPNDVIELGSVMIIVQKRSLGARPRRIWSHGYFEGRLEDECARAQRSGGSFAIVRLSVERGDARQVPELLSHHLRPGDVVAPYGPEDFELLLVETSASDAGNVVERVTARAALVGIRLRAGIACHPRDGRTPERLMAAACDRLGGASAERAAPLVPEQGVMERLHRLAERVAQGKINVLLLGETGVGKEVFAERIHELSPRSLRPLVRISCAAFPENLLESELFGHEKGAFTGADRAKPGLIESAEGGSVFLDEIGELPLSLQPKLLRVLEDRKVTRLGSVQPRSVDVRFIAATNRDLETEVQRGRFRADLYYRLSGVSLVIPPLRERSDEIPALARAFLRRAFADLGESGEPELSSDALELLTRYPWPGNVRELRNVMERAALLGGEGPILAEHLPLEKMRATLAPPPARSTDEESTDLRSGVHEYERARIVAALEQCSGNQTRAAKLLGISRMTLSARMDAFGLPRPRKDKRA
jgi:DNA-binding NtrC family response regulator